MKEVLKKPKSIDTSYRTNGLNLKIEPNEEYWRKLAEALSKKR